MNTELYAVTFTKLIVSGILEGIEVIETVSRCSARQVKEYYSLAETGDIINPCAGISRYKIINIKQVTAGQSV